MPETTNINNDLLAEAAEWQLQIEDNPSLRVSEAFERWLHTSPEHCEAFARVANAWDQAASVQAESVRTRPSIPKLSTLHSVRKFGAPVWLGGSAIAATLIVVVLSIALREPPTPQLKIATAVGEIQEQALEDGSTIFLDTNSQITPDYSENERNIEIQRGRIFVDVSEDPQRPFTVWAGNAAYIAVGTSFSVQKYKASTELQVVDGEVLVRIDASNVAAASAGDIIHVLKDGRIEHRRTAINAGQVPIWTQNRVVFDEAALSDAVIEMNRYTQTPIVLRGDDLKAHQISGVFSLTDTDAFVETVELLTNSRARISAGQIVIRENPDARN
ncbi:MAG: FecR domain-containing protein [Pseudomonadota bacterium]